MVIFRFVVMLAVAASMSVPTAALGQNAQAGAAPEEIPEYEDLPDSGVPPEECILAIREARILRKRNDVEAARERLWEAVRRYPKEVAPLLVLNEYRRYGLVPEAESARLRVLLRQRFFDPESALPFGAIAGVVEDVETPAEDIQLFLEAVTRRLASDGEDPRLLDLLALLQERTGDIAAARETLGRLLALRPSDDVRWSCFELDKKLGRWESALVLLRQLRSASKKSTRVTISLIEALARTGDLEEMKTTLRSLLDESELALSVKARSAMVVAWALHDNGNDAEAEKYFRLALEIDPDDEMAKDALLYLYGSEQEQAAHDREIAKRWAKEEDPDALLREGSSRLAAGDSAAAFPLLERAVSGMPDSEIAWFNLGLAAFGIENWERAEVALRRSLELNPNREEARFNLGAALYRLGRYEESIETMRALLASNPSLNKAHYYLYASYKKLGQTDEADEELSLYQKGQ